MSDKSSRKRLSNIDLNTVNEVDITACAMAGTYGVFTVHDAIQCSDSFRKFIAGCPTEYGPGWHKTKTMVVVDLKGSTKPSNNSRVVYPDFRIVVTPSDALKTNANNPLMHCIRSVVHKFKLEELERLGKERKYGWSP